MKMTDSTSVRRNHLFHPSPPPSALHNNKNNNNTHNNDSIKKKPLHICGCDTFVAFPPATSEGTIIFGKNSDRPYGEGQSIRRYPRTIHYSNDNNDDDKNDASKNTQKEVPLQCTYIQIPQVPITYAILLSKIDWMWGAEMGTNEYGVVIGNEAVWTREPCHAEVKSLLGMDLVRLGLERSTTSYEALQVITSLLEKYNQSGPCAENDPNFTYHNSFMIVDRVEAYVLETAGKHWVAQRIQEGVRNISNCLSIRTNYHLSSQGILQYAISKGYWKAKPTQDDNDDTDKDSDDSDNANKFDFAKAFCTGTISEEISDTRYCGGRRLLEKYAAKGGANKMNKDDMIAILRDHSSGICMHGAFETTSSWVSEITMMESTSSSSSYSSAEHVIIVDSSSNSSKKIARHWLTGNPNPCQSTFEEYDVVAKGS